MTQPSRPLFSAAILLLFGVAGTANAALVDSNEAGLGVSADGNNLTLDTVTGFYWLDIDIFYGDSYPTVEAALANTTAYADFVIAGRDDVGTFFDHLGLIVNNWPAQSSVSENGSGAYLSAQAHTGGGTGNGGEIAGFSTTSPDSGISRYIPTARYTVHGHGHGNHHDTHGNTTLSVGTLDPEIGTWIYRSTIPEPSTFSMLAFCGIAMAGYSRLRRRRK